MNSATAASRAVRTCIIGAFLILLAAASAHAQEVRGRVLDDRSDEPVAGATVTLYNRGGQRVAGAVTDSAGMFVVRAQQAGRHMIRVESFGYALNISPPIDLQPSEFLEVEFRLRAQGILLAPLTVIARRSIEPGREAFARRMESGKGVFFDPIQVAELRPKHTSDVFRHVEGIQVNPDANGNFIISSMRGWRCLAIFIDNSPAPVMFHGASSNALAVTGVVGAAPDAAVNPNTPRLVRGGGVSMAESMSLDMLDVRRLRGIEIYPSYNDVPKELRESYRGHAIWPDNYAGGCGVALVWTTVAW